LNLDTTSPETSVGVVEVTKSQDLEKTDFSVNITGTEDITVVLDQSELTATFTLGEDVETGTYIATFTCGDAQPQNVTLNVTAPKISLDKSTLTLDGGDESTSTGVIHVTRSSDIAETEISVAMSGESGVTVTPNNTTGDVTFALTDNAVEGDYTATFTCGDADPVTATITVVIPEPPVIIVDKENISFYLDNAYPSGRTQRVTVTKPPELSEDDLTVEVQGTQEITTSINQETGVITFTSTLFTMVGNYVATITCGNATPVNVAIEVTCKAPTGLSATKTSYNLIASENNRTVTVYIKRTPQYTQGEITYSFDSDSSLYEVTPTQYVKDGNNWSARFTVHKTAAGSTPNICTFNCDNHTIDITFNVLE
jgi:hypothetical protein